MIVGMREKGRKRERSRINVVIGNEDILGIMFIKQVDFVKYCDLIF